MFRKVSKSFETACEHVKEGCEAVGSSRQYIEVVITALIRLPALPSCDAGCSRRLERLLIWPLFEEEIKAQGFPHSTKSLRSSLQWP